MANRTELERSQEQKRRQRAGLSPLLTRQQQREKLDGLILFRTRFAEERRANVLGLAWALVCALAAVLILQVKVSAKAMRIAGECRQRIRLLNEQLSQVEEMVGETLREPVLEEVV